MMTYVTFALALLSLVLHFVAPRTKTTVDDKVLEAVDKAQDMLPKA